jgi:sugar lactone lactonase YvrE
MKRLLILFYISLVLFSCHRKEEAVSTTNAPNSGTSDFTDSVFTVGIEGPAVDKQGNLYAVSYQKDGTIGIIDDHGKVSLFVTLPSGSIGNGIRFNSKGEMMVADYTGHNVLAVDMTTKQVGVYAHDVTMNQPNDVAIMKNDILFCSDPNWSNNTGKLWMVDLNGKFHLLEQNMGTTNGIEVGTGDTVLYVNESVQRNVWAYSLSSNGSISNKRLLIRFDDFGMDGMRCDKNGNLYIARYGKGTIAVVTPYGKLVKEISLKGQKPTNITFGGLDRKTCYVTMQDRGVIEKFSNDVAGRE